MGLPKGSSSDGFTKGNLGRGKMRSDQDINFHSLLIDNEFLAYF